MYFCSSPHEIYEAVTNFVDRKRDQGFEIEDPILFEIGNGARSREKDQNVLHSYVKLSTTEVRTIKTKKGLSCRYCDELGSSINDVRATVLELKAEIQTRKPTVESINGPLKVKFNNVKNVHKIIKNAYHLRGVQEYQNIRIPLNRTPWQNKYDKHVKSDLGNCVANNEANLKMKYSRTDKYSKRDLMRAYYIAFNLLTGFLVFLSASQNSV
ncbi:hypothetical protein Trydic_g2459 [Trypoxylus dichotomus]